METPGAYYKRLLQAAPSDGAPLFPNISLGYADFDRQCDHIKQLMSDAALLHEHHSFGSAIFLAITAIEEIAKAEIGLYRIPGATQMVKRRKDSLFSHADKHRIAVRPASELMSIEEPIIAPSDLADLLLRVDDGWLNQIRSQSIYSDSESGEFKTPEDRNLDRHSWDILLLVPQVFDDRLLGFTDHTFQVSNQIKDLLLDE
jgi:AbiV family abortive infection protein